MNPVYDKIIEQLTASNYQDVIEELEQAGAGAATGGEWLMLTGRCLADLKHNKPGVYVLIKDLISDYRLYCKKQGLILK